MPERAVPAALQAEASILTAVSQSETLLFQQARYSYRELTDLNHALTALYAENSANTESIWSQVSSLGIYDDKNCIIVEIVDLDAEKADQFSTALPAGLPVPGAIVLAASSGFVEDNASAVYPGNGVYKPGVSGSKGSIGYRALRYTSSGTEIGFVTAAHVLNNTGNTVSTNGSLNVWASLPSDEPLLYGGSVDAAFLKITNTNYYLDNHVRNSSGVQMVNGYLTPAVGSGVYMAGNESNISYGQVVSTNVTFTTSGKSFTNLVKASYYGVNGDSGGLVYTVSNGVGTTAGIHKGNTMQEGSVIATFFVEASEINNKLNVSPYWS